MKVALYLRTANNHNGDMIFCQEESLRQWAMEHGQEIVAVYQDTAPGTSLNRPGLQSLIRELNSGAFDAVLVRNFDRLVRGLDCTLQLADTFQSAGVKIISSTEPEDALAPTIQFVNAIKSHCHTPC